MNRKQQVCQNVRYDRIGLEQVGKQRKVQRIIIV